MIIMKNRFVYLLAAALLVAVSCQKLEYVDDVGSVITDDYFRAFCKEHYDANKDGRISMNEASAVRIMGLNVHEQRIASLEGIRYMTGLVSFMIFQNLEMEVLDLQENYSLCEFQAASCQKLRTILFPGKVSSAFKCKISFCYNLQELSLPEGMEILDECVLDCTSLKTITLPSTIKEMPADAIAINGPCTLRVFAKEPPKLETSLSWTDKILVPAGSVDLYKEKWPKYADKIFQL